MKILRGDDPGPFSDIRKYKEHLQRVFEFRCAYCRTPDSRNGGLEGMTIDHFNPRVRDPTQLTAWSNLYYACSTCNCKYKQGLPTDGDIQAGLRFVDPCAEDPNDHFRMKIRAKSQKVTGVYGLTAHGNYTVEKLRFNRRKHLRSFWAEIDTHERKARGLIMALRDIMASAKSAADPERSAILQSCKMQINAANQRLRKIQSLRPFPIESVALVAPSSATATSIATRVAKSPRR